MNRFKMLWTAILAFLLAPVAKYAERNLLLYVGVPAAAGAPAYSGTFIPEIW